LKRFLVPEDDYGGPQSVIRFPWKEGVELAPDFFQVHGNVPELLRAQITDNEEVPRLHFVPAVLHDSFYDFDADGINLRMDACRHKRQKRTEDCKAYDPHAEGDARPFPALQAIYPL